MFNGLTYKKKNKYLAVGVILFAIFSYKMAFQNTIAVYQNVQSLEEQLRQAEDAPQKVNALRQQMMSIDQVLGKGGAETTLSAKSDTNVQQKLLGIVTDYCSKGDVVLREFPKTMQKTQDDYLVETNVFTVEGGFTKLLGLIYSLEQKSRIGKIASVNFLSKKDFKTKSLTLTSTIYLQNVKKVPK